MSVRVCTLTLIFTLTRILILIPTLTLAL